MSFKVESATIHDSLAQISRTMDLTLTPDVRVSAPAVEIVTGNDGAKLVVTTLRPNGSRVKIRIGHNAVPIHDVFEGQVEFIDDMTDPDTFSATIQLSSLPSKHPQRTKISMVWNNTSTVGSGEDATTAHQIIKEACDAVSLPFGRCDFPDYQVVGTYEAFRKSVVEIVNNLIQPFNAFDYLKYYVSVDVTNGLQIIGIDYSKADAAIGFNPNLVYDVPNVTTLKRSYEMYMPDNRIGDSDILLTGGDRLVSPHEEGTITLVLETTLTEDFWSSSDNDPSDTPEQYTINLNRVEFDVAMINFTTNATTLSGVVDALVHSTGLDTDLQIKASRTVYEASWQYEGGELKEFRETTYTYTTKTFKGYEQTGNIISATVQQIVLTYSEQFTQAFIKSEYPLTLVRNFFYFNEFGVQYGNETREYAAFPTPTGASWFLKQVNWSFANALDTINARIRLYLDYLRFDRTGTNPHAPGLFDPSSGVNTPNNGIDKQQVAQYQLLNGVPFSPEDLLNPKKTIDDTGKYIETDIHGNYTADEIRLRKAFQMSCPHMTYAGLRLIYAICLRQVELERRNAYWENTQLTSLIDTTLAVGGVVLAKGSVGIVEDLSHSVNANEATTSLSFRRLIVGSTPETVIL